MRKNCGDPSIDAASTKGDKGYERVFKEEKHRDFLKALWY
jgi:hypothetical protein